MKILVISSYLPYPLFSGGQVRLYNLIKSLSAHHEITLICEKRSNQTQTDIQEVEKICKKVLTVDRRKQWSIKNIAKTGTSAHSFLVTGHNHDEMNEKIREELAAHAFDLIHVETFYVMQNLPNTILSFPRKRESISGSPIRSGMTNNDIPVVLVEHNIEYQVYKRFVEKAPVVIRPLLYLDIAKIRKEEETCWKNTDKLVAVSEEDKRVMATAGYQASVVSNGVNTDQFVYKNIKKSFERKEKKILFIGDFTWIQNTDAVTWIIKEIWPELESRIKNQESRSSIKLWIVGRHIPDSIRNLTDDPDVLFDEESSAKTTPEIFQEADVLLAPIRVGGGTSYKILESMSCGTPVVTMQMSADSIHAGDGQEIMVGQNPSELASKTMQLLQDEKLYERISRGGRRLVEENYTWKEISRKLEEVYESVIVK